MSSIIKPNSTITPLVPLEKSVFWFSTVNTGDPFPPLHADIESDVVIVGGGFTGLWTAYFLKTMQPELDVVMLEQGFIGYGASGRNGGIVCPTLDHSHEEAISHFGWDEARRLADLARRNNKELADYAQGCDFEPSGQLAVALTPEHMECFKELAEMATELGVDGHRLLTAEETRQQLNSPLYRGGMMVTDGGVINPLKVVQKLKQDIVRMGVRIFENSRVTELDANIAYTASGSVSADRVVLATDAYSYHLAPKLLRRYIPFYDYVIASRPLTADEMAAIGWQNRQGVLDGRNFFKYYRLTADNRVLWGASEAAYFPTSLVSRSRDHSPSHYEMLKQSFAHHFPQLGPVEFPYGWGGPIASTTRMTPFFGSMHDGQTVYALGYTGQGIGATRVAGKILAHMVLSTPNELLKLKMVTEKPWPFPPEPVRTWMVHAVNWSLKQVDKGKKPNLLLKLLDALGIGLSS